MRRISTHLIGSILVLGVTLVVWMMPVQADGYVITEGISSSSLIADQKAIISYRDGHEDLVISIGLNLQPGQDYQDMAWVIPVPSQPEIQIVDEQIFDELDDLSAPEVIYKTEVRGPSWGLNAVAPTPAVEVLARKQVGVYDVAVLSGAEGGALLTWLHEEGFAVPDALRPPLDAYISEGWTFAAMRIAPDASNSQIQNAQPIWLSFDTGRMVYPMRLTAVQGQPIALRLYVLAEHRFELDGFGVEFAGEGKALGPDTDLASVVDGGFFLTKLFNPSVTPAEMATDFYPSQAASDEPYREQIVHTYVRSSLDGGPGFWLMELLCPCGLCWLGLVLLLVVLLVTIALLKRRRKPRGF